jgi:hypothetical protein
MNENQKKAGRPKGNPDRKAIKPNISLRRDLIAEAEAAAARKGMGLSEYVTIALIRQVARDEDSEPKQAYPLTSLTPAPPVVAKSSRSGLA